MMEVFDLAETQLHVDSVNRASSPKSGNRGKERGKKVTSGEAGKMASQEPLECHLLAFTH